MRFYIVSLVALSSVMVNLTSAKSLYKKEASVANIYQVEKQDTLRNFYKKRQIDKRTSLRNSKRFSLSSTGSDQNVNYNAGYGYSEASAADAAGYSYSGAAAAGRYDKTGASAAAASGSSTGADSDRG